MKTLSKKAPQLQAHTWRDLGSTAVLLLDAVFLFFLLIASAIMTIVGFIAVALAYLFYPIVALLSLCRQSLSIDSEESNLRL